MELDLARFLALLRRELGASEARVLEPDDASTAPRDDRELRASLPEGRALAVRFDLAIDDRDAKASRLEALAATFDAVMLEPPHQRRSRPMAAPSLQDELRALCDRAGAVNTLVIDANSPVVWGAAHPAGLIGEAPLESAPVVPLVPPVDAAPADERAQEAARVKDVSRRALRSVRALITTAALRKGKHVRHVERGGRSPLLARSFAGIYLAVAAFDAPFDELRAERAMIESLPRIERLVLALPPLDPSPDTGAGAISMRRSRRR